MFNFFSKLFDKLISFTIHWRVSDLPVFNFAFHPEDEKRNHSRYKIPEGYDVPVFVSNNNSRTKAIIENLSNGGVAVKGEKPLGLYPGAVCELIFMFPGKITELHRRTAKVIYVSNGITGFAIIDPKRISLDLISLYAQKGMKNA